MRLLEHLSVTALATVCAALIIVPLGLWAGHHRPSDGTNRRRSNLLMSAVAATRALPALGLLTILALWLGVSTLPALIVLIIIAAAPCSPESLKASPPCRKTSWTQPAPRASPNGRF